MSEPNDEPPKPKKRGWAGPKGESAASPRAGSGEKLKTRDRRTPAQAAWLQRQLDDPYVRRAKAEGYRARAAYKLLELDERFGLLKKGQRVADLGAAPGSWSQIARKRGAQAVVGIDLLPVEAIASVTLIVGDFLDDAMAQAVLDALGGPPDLVLSDMAANTTGHARTDQIRTGALAEAAARFALGHLAPGGAFVTKAFQGGLDAQLLADLKRAFATVRHAKPPASRAESSEVYVIAQGFKGAA
jgi:23S rRNA (uridine2552-2'-O)-methyltransferase